MQDEEQATILGDMEEHYHALRTERGRFGAACWYYGQAVLSLPVLTVGLVQRQVRDRDQQLAPGQAQDPGGQGTVGALDRQGQLHEAATFGGAAEQGRDLRTRAIQSCGCAAAEDVARRRVAPQLA